MFDFGFEDTSIDWPDILQRAERLPKHLKAVLVLRVKGIPQDKIARILGVSLRSVKTYNNLLNDHFNIAGLTPTEKDFYYALVVRQVVKHIKQYPRMAEVIEAYQSLEMDTPAPTTQTTRHLPRAVFTDPRDATLALRFVVVIVLTLVAIAALIIFTPILIYLGI